jgi:hypothetical protein
MLLLDAVKLRRNFGPPHFTTITLLYDKIGRAAFPALILTGWRRRVVALAI